MPNEDTIFLKTSVDVLSFLDPDQLRKVTPDIERNTYANGDTVLFKGQITDGFYIIKKGKATLIAKDASGQAKAHTLSAGDFFGEMSVLEEIASTDSIKVSEDGTEILTIPHLSFQKLLSIQPLLKKGLLDKVAKRKK